MAAIVVVGDKNGCELLELIIVVVIVVVVVGAAAFVPDDDEDDDPIKERDDFRWRTGNGGGTSDADNDCDAHDKIMAGDAIVAGAVVDEEDGKDGLEEVPKVTKDELLDEALKMLEVAPPLELLPKFKVPKFVERFKLVSKYDFPL